MCYCHHPLEFLWHRTKENDVKEKVFTNKKRKSVAFICVQPHLLLYPDIKSIATNAF